MTQATRTHIDLYKRKIKAQYYKSAFISFLAGFLIIAIYRILIAEKKINMLNINDVYISTAMSFVIALFFTLYTILYYRCPSCKTCNKYIDLESYFVNQSVSIKNIFQMQFIYLRRYYTLGTFCFGCGFTNFREKTDHSLTSHTIVKMKK